jgi:RNA-binding protein Musashi
MAAAAYNKFLGPAYHLGYHHRYTPYPMPMAAAQQSPTPQQQAMTPQQSAAHAVAMQAAVPQQQQQQQQQMAAAGGAPGSNPYQGYSLTNVDMSSFQGVDWGSMYGMGMYV